MLLAAFISGDYERVCERLGIVVTHIQSRQSWQNMIETHFDIQRKMTDDQFSHCQTEEELQLNTPALSRFTIAASISLIKNVKPMRARCKPFYPGCADVWWKLHQ
jgi:hypothetical protein